MHPLDTPVPEFILKADVAAPAPIQATVINMTVDVKHLVETFCQTAMRNYDWAYSGGNLQTERVHTAMQAMRHNVIAIQELLKAIK